ncbi:MAG: cystathionine beta-synthase, partial [Vicingaceae bacterium]
TRIDGSWDGCSGYHYSDNVIYGFSHTHLNGTGVSDFGDIMLMPTMGEPSFDNKDSNVEANKTAVINSIKTITGSNTKALVASSGLSIQYAILMGLIHDAKEKHKGKAIKIVVPPNCYGGTNDQARRVAACIDNVEVVDLPVDGD